MEDSAMHELEGDQEAPDSPIAVEERVDRFELRMAQSDMKERRKASIQAQKSLELIESTSHVEDGWRHERRLGDRCAIRPDPVLDSPELAGIATAPSSAAQGF